MKVETISIAACIWQSGHFNPLLLKNEKGLWAFPSETYNLEKDDDFARQTLERGLHRLFKGTLNSMNLNRTGFACKFALASDRAYATATNRDGSRLISGPSRSEEPAHLHIVVPLFEVTFALNENTLPETETLSHLEQRHSRIHSAVTRTLEANGKVWRKLERTKRFVPMRQNFGQLGGQLNRMNVPKPIVLKLTDPKTEDYWTPKDGSLKNVA